MIDPTKKYEEKYLKAKNEFLAYFKKLKSNLPRMNDEEIHVSLETLIDKFYDVDTISSMYYQMKGIDYAVDYERRHND